jgi:hypothetical protein
LISTYDAANYEAFSAYERINPPSVINATKSSQLGSNVKLETREVWLRKGG